MIAILLSGLSLAVWVYLLGFRGRFWRADQRDDLGPCPPAPAAWPAVVAVVPARDEADVVAGAVGSLLAQDYPGPLRVVLVDDASTDGTAAVARAEATRRGSDRLEVLAGAPLPPGWTGKLWAMSQGIAHAGSRAEFLWLTDADIAHGPGDLRGLVARAQAEGLALSSQMVRLSCVTAAERLLVPAFVFFFQMLYPFPQVNRPGSRTAGAAGGCMLVRREALERAGGIAAIRSALIDDCALAALLKRRGPVRLALTAQAHSLRPYARFGEISAMVSRSAYAQLGYSPAKLAGCLLGMALVYLAPPVFAVFGHGVARAAGGAAWLMMAASFQPTLRLYGRSLLWGLALPLIGALYCGFTVQSAVDVWRGRGGRWKGRSQAQMETQLQSSAEVHA